MSPVARGGKGALGVEPRLSWSKHGVLPLDDTPEESRDGATRTPTMSRFRSERPTIGPRPEGGVSGGIRTRVYPVCGRIPRLLGTLTKRLGAQATILDDEFQRLVCCRLHQPPSGESRRQEATARRALPVLVTPGGRSSGSPGSARHRPHRGPPSGVLVVDVAVIAGRSPRSGRREVVDAVRLELTTFRISAGCSNQLSFASMKWRAPGDLNPAPAVNGRDSDPCRAWGP